MTSRSPEPSVRPIVVAVGEAMSDGSPSRHHPPAAESVDPSGAGDAFFGTYVAHRIAGVEPTVALERSMTRAAVVVQSPGALGHD